MWVSGQAYSYVFLFLEDKRSVYVYTEISLFVLLNGNSSVVGVYFEGVHLFIGKQKELVKAETVVIWGAVIVTWRNTYNSSIHRRLTSESG